ncbi:MAG: nitrilase-related carbon-nitrogen hydrolase [Spirochaetota bacterium]
MSSETCTRPGPTSRRLLVALFFTISTLGLLAEPAEPANGDHVLTVASVQFNVDREIYGSVSAFRRAADRLVAAAVRRYDADIVVFPEYINVFLVAARYPSVVREAESLGGALRLLRERHGVSGVRELFVREARWLGETTRTIWSELADTHEATIIAGTGFMEASDGGRRVLRNRALVFDESGALVYWQDKAYLTPMEASVLGLDAADTEPAEPFEVDGVSVGLTICRDTYFESWHEEFPEIDLWVDLRANGEPYTPEVYERFLATLPERVEASSAVAGVNASLTGSFLDLAWEGPSYLVDEDGRRIGATRDETGTEIIAVTLTADGDEWMIEIPATSPQSR